MPTEAIHTPFLGDRALSLENARYVMRHGAPPRRGDRDQAGRHASSGARRRCSAARCAILERVAERGLMHAIEAGTFAQVRRRATAAAASTACSSKDATYWNPFAGTLAYAA